MKVTEQYFPVVLFIMLYKVILTFETVDEILKCDHSNESYCALLFYAVQCLAFESVDETVKYSSESSLVHSGISRNVFLKRSTKSELI